MLKQTTEDRNTQLVELCRDLIRIPSYSGQEQQVAQRIESAMKEYGFDEVSIDKNGSIVGCFIGKYPGKTILLDGHIDTVQVLDADKWQHDPFAAEIENGKIFGRGTSDMKGSVAAMLSAAAMFATDTNRKFKGRIYVSGTVHEECFEGISSRTVTENVRPDIVIVGEATTGTVKIGQRGRAEIIVETEGVSCHSSNPEKGINAVYAMWPIIEAIRNIVPPEHPLLGKGILELTDIISSPYPGSSVVPAACKATFDRRTLVGETEESILKPIQEAIATVKQKDPTIKAKTYLSQGSGICWTGATISAKRFFPAWETKADTPLVTKVRTGLDKVGIKAPLSHFAFCTNGSHFCGEAKIPTIGFGPSLESLAHVRDEYIEIDQLIMACKGFYGIIMEALTAE
ncbi:MAG: YgeY family selenium metabolism-linked hydrolase [Spirochaetia bacterium]|jgi:putative selenium metabolism hydrolase|nr:YgeY family selenium metabolism-linked hydrolase [Spirochaetia bacterium]